MISVADHGGVGAFLCVLSAVGFGLMAVFAKLAYGEGVSVDGLLVARFGLAGVVLLVVAAGTGALRRLDRRSLLAGLGMGAFGYAVQAGLYLGAVSKVDASQVALVFCVYPVLVMVAAIAIGRERGSRRRLVALVMALAGIVLVLGGAASGSFDLVGALLSFGSALVYCCYILVGDRVVGDAEPVALTALICVGGFTSCLIASLVVGGGPDLDVGLAAWGWLGALALVSTVGAVLLFFAGLARVGPTIASLVSIVEPVVTVVSAALVFHEALSGVQALGGALVLASVAVVQWPARRTPAVAGLPAESARVHRDVDEDAIAG
jgi:drug/metabolite transporter (DMT)-like permease